MNLLSIETLKHVKPFQTIHTSCMYIATSIQHPCLPVTILTVFNQWKANLIPFSFVLLSHTLYVILSCDSKEINSNSFLLSLDFCFYIYSLDPSSHHPKNIFIIIIINVIFFISLWSHQFGEESLLFGTQYRSQQVNMYTDIHWIEWNRSFDLFKTKSNHTAKNIMKKVQRMEMEIGRGWKVVV